MYVPFLLLLSLPSTCLLTLQITLAIGDEIRDTSNLTDLNDTFDNTRVRLRGNMNRMLRMAERTGVGWRMWVVFFIAVFFIFAYVWLT